MPWEGGEEGAKASKYKYHPHGDKNQPLREAPSALNTVIVPNVTLPVVCCSSRVIIIDLSLTADMTGSPREI